jgi:hypothetical protein
MTGYEFTEQEEELFTELSQYMIVASLFFIILGGIGLARAIFVEVNIFFLVFGISMIVLGFAFFIPTDNFRKIAETKGSDILELLQAFREIRTAWGILIIILIAHRLNVILQFFI